MRWKALDKIYTMHSFAPFSNLNFFVKNRQNFFAIELMNIHNSIANNSNFAFSLRTFDEFFSGFRAKFQKIVTCAAFSIKFAKTNQKFAENSEFCEKNSLLLVNYSLLSLVAASGKRTVAALAAVKPDPLRVAAPAEEGLPIFFVPVFSLIGISHIPIKLCK